MLQVFFVRLASNVIKCLKLINDSMKDFFGSISAIKAHDHHDIALGLLQRAASIACPIMKKRQWVVKSLQEFIPKVSIAITTTVQILYHVRYYCLERELIRT